jgi:hypothetical protein
LWRIVGLLVLGCSIAVGLLPSHRTVVVLILVLFIVVLVWWLAAAWRHSRFILREQDGTLPSLWFILLAGGIAGPVFEGFVVWIFLFASINPPPERACLCASRPGLATALVSGGWAVLGAFGLATGLVAIVGAIARVRLEWR